MERAGKCHEIRAVVCASVGFSAWLWVSGTGLPEGREGSKKERGGD